MVAKVSAVGPREGGHSPWGAIDQVETLVEGAAWFASTPSHGGVKLSRALNAKVPAPLRKEGGWYEEDCEYAIPAIFFADVRAALKMTQEAAEKVVKNYFPDAYTAATGKPVSVSESYVLRRRDFAARTKNKLVTVSAIGSDSRPGFVVVTTCVGGRRPDGRFANSETRRFLVPTDEYRWSVDESFVVEDPTRYPEVGPAFR